MPLDLDFSGLWSPPANGLADLEFGRTGEPPVALSDARLSVVTRQAAFAAVAHYDIRVFRPVTGSGTLAWESGQRAHVSPGDTWSRTRPHRHRAENGWQQARAQAEGRNTPWGATRALRNRAESGWQDAQTIPASTKAAFETLHRHRLRVEKVWQQAQPLGLVSGIPWVVLVPFPRKLALPWETTVAVQRDYGFRFQPGVRRLLLRGFPWQEARKPPPGISARITPPPVVEPEGRLPPIDLDLRCRCLPDWRPELILNFSTHPCPERGRVVPVLKVYFVSNAVDVVRLPSREPVPVTSLSLSLDDGAWAWGFSASLPYRALEMVAPDRGGPVEIEIRINDIVWIMLVEGFDARREFGQETATIQGRSRAAWLAEPFAPKRSFSPDDPFTARQLADLELERPGLSTGFNLAWQLPDWLVPSGAWSYRSLTPLSAILRIVESVGGNLISHPSLLQLTARSRYPEPPWRWNTVTPDLSLPVDVVRSLSARYLEKPEFDAVIIAGERKGIVGRVKRTGTAGNRLAPMVVDGLITHADAARERGTTMLADVGRQAVVTLELPMLPTIGLLEPGQLLGVGEGDGGWRGLVRSTRVAASWTETLSVRQTVDVERHYL